jgi:hypothetical protein
VEFNPQKRKNTMKGIITTKDLIFQFPCIISGFGLGFYIFCWKQVLSANHEVTFLECIMLYPLVLIKKGKKND